MAATLEMDSEGRIVDVVLGTEFLTMTAERAIIKLGLQTGAGRSHGKSVQAPIRFVIKYSSKRSGKKQEHGHLCYYEKTSSIG